MSLLPFESPAARDRSSSAAEAALKKSARLLAQESRLPGNKPFAPQLEKARQRQRPESEQSTASARGAEAQEASRRQAEKTARQASDRASKHAMNRSAEQAAQKAAEKSTDLAEEARSAAERRQARETQRAELQARRAEAERRAQDKKAAESKAAHAESGPTRQRPTQETGAVLTEGDSDDRPAEALSASESRHAPHSSKTGDADQEIDAENETPSPLADREAVNHSTEMETADEITMSGQPMDGDSEAESTPRLESDTLQPSALPGEGQPEETAEKGLSAGVSPMAATVSDPNGAQGRAAGAPGLDPNREAGTKVEPGAPNPAIAVTNPAQGLEARPRDAAQARWNAEAVPAAAAAAEMEAGDVVTGKAERFSATAKDLGRPSDATGEKASAAREQIPQFPQENPKTEEVAARDRSQSALAGPAPTPTKAASGASLGAEAALSKQHGGADAKAGNATAQSLLASVEVEADAQASLSSGKTPAQTPSDDPLLREALARAGMSLQGQTPRASEKGESSRRSETENPRAVTEGEGGDEGEAKTPNGLAAAKSVLAGREAAGHGAGDGSPGRDGAASPAQEFGETRAASKEPAPEAAADKKAPPLPVRMPFLHAVLAKEIAARSVALSMNGREELRLRLDPPHLGRVQVEIEMKNGRINARIGVEHEAARQQVEQQLSSLREALESQGLKPQSLEVSVQERDAGWTQGFARDAAARRRSNSGEADESLPEEVSPGRKDTGRRFGFNSVEYVG